MVMMNYMLKDEVISYLNNNFGAFYSEPQMIVHNIEDREFYSTNDVANLFTNKKMWREMECHVTTYMFGVAKEMLENLDTEN